MEMKIDARIVNAISVAVRHAIAVVGMEGLRRTSMFPSAAKAEAYKLAA